MRFGNYMEEIVVRRGIVGLLDYLPTDYSDRHGRENIGQLCIRIKGLQFLRYSFS